jgi:hypothetical protein
MILFLIHVEIIHYQVILSYVPAMIPPYFVIAPIPIYIYNIIDTKKKFIYLYQSKKK